MSVDESGPEDTQPIRRSLAQRRSESFQRFVGFVLSPLPKCTTLSPAPSISQ